MKTLVTTVALVAIAATCASNLRAGAPATTGVLPGNRRVLPPMPDYRFSADDARDVIAYLRRPIAPQPPAAATDRR